MKSMNIMMPKCPIQIKTQSGETYNYASPLHLLKEMSDNANPYLPKPNELILRIKINGEIQWTLVSQRVEYALKVIRQEFLQNINILLYE